MTRLSLVLAAALIMAVAGCASSRGDAGGESLADPAARVPAQGEVQVRSSLDTEVDNFLATTPPPTVNRTPGALATMSVLDTEVGDRIDDNDTERYFTLKRRGSLKGPLGLARMGNELSLPAMTKPDSWFHAAAAEKAEDKYAPPKVTPPHPSHKVPANLAEQATDPSAVLAQLGFFYWNSRAEGTHDTSNTFLFQPVLPVLGKHGNVLRPALPIVSTPGADGVTGFGDLFDLDVKIMNAKKASYGFGGVLSIPIASDDKLGSGKWELGPAFLYLYKGIPKNILGLILYNMWSIAGEGGRENVNKLIFQIVWVKHFKWGYIGWTDQTGIVDWQNDAALSFPVGLRFGKVWMGHTPLNAAVQPYYTFNEQGPDTFGLKFSATWIMRKWFQPKKK